MSAHTFFALKLFDLEQKRTDSIDFFKPLRNYIERQYGTTIAKDFDTPTQNIHQRRNELRNLQDKNEASRDHVIRYYQDLKFVEKHFPTSSASGGAASDGNLSVVVSFPWYDTFSKRKTTQNNIFYEQANVLFLAAVLCQQIASAQARTSSETIIASSKYYKLAGSLFQFIYSEIVSQKIVERIPNDLTQECLSFLQNLMLAEQQQCVCENAAKKEMKLLIQSQLAQGAADLYKKCVQDLNASKMLKEEEIDKNWQGYIIFKQYYFQAVAQFLYALDEMDKCNIGQALSRINYCLQLLKTAANEPSKLSTSLRDSIKVLEQEVIKKQQEAHKDNEKVYHERIPPVDQLKPIESKILAKSSVEEAQTLLTSDSYQSSDPFVKLYPVHVMQAREQFKQQLASKLDAVFVKQRQHRESIMQQLNMRELPASVVSFAQQLQSGTNTGGRGGNMSGIRFPEDVHSKIGAIAKQGGSTRINELKLTLDEMANQSRELFAKIDKLIQEEEQEDQDCRQQFGNRWQRVPSTQLTVNLKKQRADYENKINMAKKSDDMVNKKIADFEESWKKFELSREEIDNLLPKDTDSNAAHLLAQKMYNQSPELKQSFEALKDILSQLDQCFAQEEQLEVSLKAARERGGSEDFEQRLLEQSATTIGNVTLKEMESFDKEIAKYGPLQQKEDALLSQVDQHNQVFKATKDQQQKQQSQQQQQVQHDREKMIQQMYMSIQKYDEVLSNIREGINFYSTMQDLIRRLTQRVEDFTFSRRVEKQDLIYGLQQAVSGMAFQQPTYGAQQYMNPYQQPISSTNASSPYQQQQQPQQQRSLPPPPYQQQNQYYQPNYQYPPQQRK